MNATRMLDEIVKKNSSNLDIIKRITPINLNEENERFLKLYHGGILYNPQYIYNSNSELNHIKEKIEEINFDSNSTIGSIYKRYQEYLLDCIEITNLIGKTYEFTKMSIKIFGSPSNDILQKAIVILNDHNKNDYNNEEQYDAKCMRQIFIDEIKKHAFDWNVEIIDNISSKVAVDPDEKKIYINGKVLFSKNDMSRLLVHEFGTHVMRAENGSKQPYFIFQNGFPKSIETEEGLATYNEWKNNLLDTKTLRIYAGRVLAVKLSLEKSFYEAFIELNKFFLEEESIRMISRVKRGLEDTSQPGAFTKDFVYLNGFFKVKDNINLDTEKILYSGIIGLDDIKQVSLLNNIIY